MINLIYFIKSYGYNALPDFYFRNNYKRLKKIENKLNKTELNERLDYYFKINKNFEIPKEAVAIKDYKKTVGTFYYLDLKEFLHYFSPSTKFAYHFGDETHINPYPTLFKARPIDGINENSILFKLNKRRHFKWVEDPFSFSEKKDMLVWRGTAYIPHRKQFVKKFWQQPLFNVGQTNKHPEDVPWQTERMPIEEQLKYKFIFSIEGNDVATSLKWILSSNSLCFTPKLRNETWFMEGSLIPGEHYIQVNDDFSDIEVKIEYYSTHIKEAEEIIENANRHAARFQNKNIEDLLCLKVLERYAELSGQTNALKF